MFRFLLSLSLFLFFISCVFALNATTSDDTGVKSIEDIFELTDVGEGRRRRKNKFPFGHQIWWWGLKALSVFITVKIKIILLVLFLGGGIFYALKVWNGTALGCPEPIIQEIKHHGIDFLPYHGHHDFSPSDLYSGYPGISGYDPSNSGVFSNTPPPSYSNSNAGVSMNGPQPSYPSPSYPSPYSSSSSAAAGVGPPDTSGPSNEYLPPNNAYLPPSNRRTSFQGRAIDTESSQMATDLMFRFLGVNTFECKRRFVCELEFRNPMVEHAMRYFGHDLFTEYRTAKESKAKKFTDCAILYPDCSFPKQSVRVRKRNGVSMKKNETIVDTTTEVPDSVTKYVKNGI